MCIELSHLDTDEGVNFTGGLEFFYPGTCGKRQVPNYPPFLLPNNTSIYQISHMYFFNAPKLGLYKYSLEYSLCISAPGLESSGSTLSGGRGAFTIFSGTTVMMKDPEIVDLESSYMKKLME